MLAITFSSGDSKASCVRVKLVFGLTTLAVCTTGCGVTGNGGVLIFVIPPGKINLSAKFLIDGTIDFKVLRKKVSSGIGLPLLSNIRLPLSIIALIFYSILFRKIVR